MVAGDFNEVLYQNEVSKRYLRLESYMSWFKENLEWNELQNLGCVEPSFTLFSGLTGNNVTWERLDRIVGNGSFKQSFLFSRMKSLQLHILNILQWYFSWRLKGHGPEGGV